MKLRSSLPFFVAVICTLALGHLDPCSGQAVPAPAGAIPSALAAPEVTALELGKPVERELAAGETQLYSVVLRAGDYMRVVVEQRGIEVSLSASLLSEAPATAVECSGGAYGVLELHAISKNDGMASLEVRAAKPGAKSGHFRIRLEEVGRADTRRKGRVAAASAFAEAVRLRSDQKEESQRKAIELFEQGARLWAESGVASAEAASWSGIGEIYNEMGESAKALTCHERALPLRRAAGDRMGEAWTLSNIGLSHHALGDLAKALDEHGGALAIFRAAGDRENEAGQLINLGSLYDERGESEKCLSLTGEALALFRTSGDREMQAVALNNIAVTLVELGRLQEALDGYLEALRLVRQIGMRRGEAVLLGNVGSLYGELGELDRAQAYADESLALRRTLGDRASEAAQISKIAEIEISRGRLEKGLETLSAALVLQRELGEHAGEAATLRRMARAETEGGSPVRAVERLDSAVIAAREAGDLHVEAVVLAELGGAQAAAGRLQEATVSLGQAVEKLRALGDHLGLARALALSAQLRREAGDLEAARRSVEEALGIVESSRAALTSRTLRLAYPGAVRQIYETAVDVFVALHEREPESGFGARAFESSERMRARSLLELLGEAHVDLRQGVEPALVERARVLERLLAARGEAQVQLLASRASSEEGAGLTKEIGKLAEEYDEVESKIRAGNPRYAAITRVGVPSLADLQGRLLGEDDLLLEYSLGARRSFLFAVTRHAFRVWPLPPGADIDRAARAVIESLRHPGRGQAGPEAVQKLSKLVLGPVANWIERRRLLVVSDGALHFVPFAALPIPAGRRSPAAPLLAAHEVVGLPSVSVLEMLRQSTAGRASPSKTLAVFADPVFDEEDDRVRKARGKQPRPGQFAAPDEQTTAAPGSLERSLRDVGEKGSTRLPRLAFTRREAKSVLRLVPPGQRREALDFEANKSEAIQPDLGGYRFLHFATHGLLNTSHPDLSGIVLSLVDASGRKQDGFLSGLEVFRLRLSADLVVLSACQTALGKEIRGEGLVGLVRAFMYAGAPRVVASLWRVDDAATAELMKRFYQGMLGPKKLRPAAALREAQIWMRQQSRWQDPYYWAAFVLQGEWR